MLIKATCNRSSGKNTSNIAKQIKLSLSTKINYLFPKMHKTKITRLKTKYMQIDVHHLCMIDSIFDQFFQPILLTNAFLWKLLIINFKIAYKYFRIQVLYIYDNRLYLVIIPCMLQNNLEQISVAELVWRRGNIQGNTHSINVSVLS